MPTQESDRQLESGERAQTEEGRRFRLGPETVEHPEEIAAIYNELYPDLRAHAMKLVRSPERADDAIQAAFVNTIDTLKRGREIEQGDRWLHRCVRNACLHELRTERTVSDDQLGEMTAAGDLVESAHWRVRSEQLYKAVGDLPEHLRTALLLAEVRGLTYIEVAAQMRRSVDSVRALIFRARAELRDVLGPRAEGLVAPLAGALAVGRAAKRLWRRAHETFTAKLGEAHSQLPGSVARALRPVYEQALTLGALGLLTAGLGGPGPARMPTTGSASRPAVAVRLQMSADAPHGARARSAPRGRAGTIPAAPTPTDRAGTTPPGDSGARPLEPHRDGSTERPASTTSLPNRSLPAAPGDEVKEPGGPPVAAPTPIDPPDATEPLADSAEIDPDGSLGAQGAGPNGVISVACHGQKDDEPAPGNPSQTQAGGLDGCVAAQPGPHPHAVESY